MPPFSLAPTRHAQLAHTNYPIQSCPPAGPLCGHWYAPPRPCPPLPAQDVAQRPEGPPTKIVSPLDAGRFLGISAWGFTKRNEIFHVRACARARMHGLPPYLHACMHALGWVELAAPACCAWTPRLQDHAMPCQDHAMMVCALWAAGPCGHAGICMGVRDGVPHRCRATCAGGAGPARMDVQRHIRVAGNKAATAGSAAARLYASRLVCILYSTARASARER